MLKTNNFVFSVNKVVLDCLFGAKKICFFPHKYSPVPQDSHNNGCETWSLAFRKECRLRVFENRVLRGIFGPKRDEVTGVEKTT